MTHTSWSLLRPSRTLATLDFPTPVPPKIKIRGQGNLSLQDVSK